MADNDISYSDQMYFIISTKAPNGEIISDTLSLQKLEPTNELYQIVVKKDPNTGKYIEDKLPLIAVNYVTSINNYNPERNCSIVTISRKTRKGVYEQQLYVNNESCSFYEDDIAFIQTKNKKGEAKTAIEVTEKTIYKKDTPAAAAYMENNQDFFSRITEFVRITREDCPVWFKMAALE